MGQAPLPQVTSTPEPAPTARPMIPSPGTGAGQLVARSTGASPTVDGEVEHLWESAQPLRVPLTWGAQGTEHALDVELRALHDERSLYLLAQWHGDPPKDEADVVYNQFTVHWRIPEPDAAHLDCNVACHTVFADGKGHVAYANAETIPYGGSEALEAAGGWEAGTWTLEWSRPLGNGNPFDLQFDDRDRTYRFLIKVFSRIEDRPDPISKPQQLVFAP